MQRAYSRAVYAIERSMKCQHGIEYTREKRAAAACMVLWEAGVGKWLSE